MVSFFLILLLLVAVPLGVGTLVLMTNKGPKAAEIKDLLKALWSNLKDLFANLSKLYVATEEFIKELTGRSKEAVESSRDKQDGKEAEVTLEVTEVAEVDSSTGIAEASDSAQKAEPSEISAAAVTPESSSGAQKTEVSAAESPLINSEPVRAAQGLPSPAITGELNKKEGVDLPEQTVEGNDPKPSVEDPREENQLP